MISTAERKVLWSPQPGPQTALIECPVFEVFYGGARGGGKTESSLGDWMEHMNTWGELANGAFFRRKRSDLSDVVARSKQLFPALGGKFNENKSQWTFENGARLAFEYLERDKDAENYQGKSFTRIYIEEATQFPSPAPIMKLKGTLRSAGGAHVGMRLTGNPGGPGHNWVKARYITPNPTGFQVITETEELEIDGVKVVASLSRVFIPSKVWDNKLLMQSDPTYILRLRQAGSESLVKAWLNGDWNIIDGAFFSEWDESRHVLDTQLWLPQIPRDALRFRAFDWGSAKPFSCGWYAVSDGEWGLPRGALVKYREWYGAKGPNVGLKMDAAHVAQGIRDRELKERVRYGVADPAIFIRNGGPSIGEEMAKHGASWRLADNKRIPGWEQMRQRLVGDGNEPMLYFLDCCEDSIRTIPLLQHDDVNAEDIDTEGEDHAGDETRYACMSRPWVPAGVDSAPPGSHSGKLTFMGALNLVRKQRLEGKVYNG